MLYRGIDVDEETPVQFAGVCVTKWRPEWGEPTILFYGVPDDELAEHLDVDTLNALARKASEVQALAKFNRDLLAKLVYEGTISDDDAGTLERLLAPFETAR
jgi:hypothetical protein